MDALRARVRGGRLVLDEPTDLPEGEVVELVPLDDVAMVAELDADETARLHDSLRESIRQMKAGAAVDARAALEALRSKR